MIIGIREQLLDGRRAMAHLIHVWHERNGWSHKVLPALAQSLDLGRLHSSQISNLRNGKLAAPGPEVFLALAQTNAVLHSGIDSIKDHLAEVHPELLKVLSESALSLDGENGLPLGAGELLEIFLGISSLPSRFDWFIQDHEASSISAALADLLCRGNTWRYCREEVLMAYPIKNQERRERFASVMAGLRDFTSQELDGELLDLHETCLALGVNKGLSVEEFLDILRNRSERINKKFHSVEE